jgi:RimJ/RimL family protein N-acetyltransferase
VTADSPLSARAAPASSPQVPPVVELLQLPASVIDALAGGDLAVANDRLSAEGFVGAGWTLTGSQAQAGATSGRVVGAAASDPGSGDEAKAPTPALTPYLVTPESRRTWRVRSDQIAADPAAAEWVTRVVYDRLRRVVVGKAGFHGPPDEHGMVEIGYATDPLLRRRGYARAAVEVMLEHARNSPHVRTVRASISPANSSSQRLVAQYGFVTVGEQMDDEDGLEIVYEVAA